MFSVFPFWKLSDPHHIRPCQGRERHGNWEVRCTDSAKQTDCEPRVSDSRPGLCFPPLCCPRGGRGPELFTFHFQPLQIKQRYKFSRSVLLATFQVLSSDMWPVATVLASTEGAACHRKGLPDGATLHTAPKLSRNLKYAQVQTKKCCMLSGACGAEVKTHLQPHKIQE